MLLPDTRTTSTVRTTSSVLAKGDENTTCRVSSHGESLVQVHVTNITTTDRWIGQSDLGVEVGTIKVDLATIVVDDLASLLSPY